VLLFLPLFPPLCEVVLDHTRSGTKAANTACPGGERPAPGRVTCDARPVYRWRTVGGRPGFRPPAEGRDY